MDGVSTSFLKVEECFHICGIYKQRFLYLQGKWTETIYLRMVMKGQRYVGFRWYVVTI